MNFWSILLFSFCNATLKLNVAKIFKQMVRNTFCGIRKRQGCKHPTNKTKYTSFFHRRTMGKKHWTHQLHILQWNLDTASLDTALILLLSQFFIMPDFFPSLSLLIKPQYSVIFTTSILLQHQFFCKPKTFFSYIFQPRYNINLKNGIFTIDKRKW